MRSQRNVQEYQNSFQFRSASHCRRDSCGLASVREEISGFNKPSKANEGSFMAAVDEIAEISTGLLRSLEPNAPSRNRSEFANGDFRRE